MFNQELKESKLVEGIRTMGMNYCIFYKEYDEGNYLCLRNGHGLYLDINDAKTLIQGLKNYCDSFNQEEIERENSEILDEVLKDMYKNTSPDYRKPERKKQKGYIYFITTNNIEYKIGRAKNMKSRMGEYTKLPHEPQIIHVIESNDYVITEELFHEYYKDKRLRGEWFKLTDEDVKYIKNGKYTDKIMKSIK